MHLRKRSAPSPAKSAGWTASPPRPPIPGDAHENRKARFPLADSSSDSARPHRLRVSVRRTHLHFSPADSRHLYRRSRNFRHDPHDRVESAAAAHYSGCSGRCRSFCRRLCLPEPFCQPSGYAGHIRRCQRRQLRRSPGSSAGTAASGP